jgi:DNA-binding SARP family transcriptional activator/tetratricopeptide (TPR) repeat protein
VSAPDSAADALAERLDRSDVDLVIISAPAGFGKTTLATLLAQKRSARGFCDAAVSTVVDLARASLKALAEENPDQSTAIAEAGASLQTTADSGWIDLARRLWTRAPDSPSSFVFDNLETIVDRGSCVAFLGSLLASRPKGRRAILCSRVPIPKELARHALPHRTEWVRADALQVSTSEIRAIFEPLGVRTEVVEQVEQLSAGWPIAVLLMARLAREGRLEHVIRDLRGAAFETLFEYLSTEYLDSLELPVRDAIIGAAAIPRVSLSELASWSKVPLKECAQFVQSSPFLRESNDEQIEAHPLLRALVAARYRYHAAEVVESAIADCVRRQEFIRAAELALSIEDRTRAADLLSKLGSPPPEKLFSRLVALVANLDVEDIVARPTLWLATLEVRSFGIRPEDLVAEARRIRAILPPSADSRLKTEIAIQFCIALWHAGLVPEALKVFDETLLSETDADLVFRIHLVRADLETLLGRYEEARRLYRQALATTQNASVYRRYLDGLAAWEAFFSGDYEGGVALLEEAVRIGRRHGWISPLLISLANVMFQAWLVRDEARFNRAVAETRELILPGLDKAWSFWLSAAAGEASAQPTGYERLGIRAVGHLFIADATDRETRLAEIQRAISVADRSHDIHIRILTRIAAAEYDKRGRSEILSQLRLLAQDVEIPAFQRAINAYVDESGELGALTRYVNHRLRMRAEPGTMLVIDLLSGRLKRDGLPIDLSGREHALTTLLAISGRPMHRDALCDALWPDLDGDAAANNLKGLVHRLRKKLGDGAIAHIADGYCLGAGIRVDLSEAEQFVNAGVTAVIMSDADHARFKHIAETLRSRFRGDLLNYEWYVALDHRLDELRRQSLLALAGDANRKRQFAAALRIAEEQLQADPTDEAACRLVLEAHFGLGDVAAARRALSRFEEICRRDGDSAAIRRIQEAFAHFSGGPQAATAAN